MNDAWQKILDAKANGEADAERVKRMREADARAFNELRNQVMFARLIGLFRRGMAAR
jgi:hypothetical protein